MDDTDIFQGGYIHVWILKAFCSVFKIRSNKRVAVVIQPAYQVISSSVCS